MLLSKLTYKIHATSDAGRTYFENSNTYEVPLQYFPLDALFFVLILVAFSKKESW